MAVMLLTEIDHVAIAVHDGSGHRVLRQGLRGDGRSSRDRRVGRRRGGPPEGRRRLVQLLTPIRDDSPVAKAIAERGEGLHHIGYRVDDCAAALESIKAAGATPIDAAPRPGSRGTTVAFIHPKSSFGTLIELVQESA